MKNYFKFKKRSLSKVIAGILSLSLFAAFPSFAAEPSSSSDFLTLEEAGMSREEAIEMFDLTDEEATKSTFYVIDDSMFSSDIQTFSTIDPTHPYDSGYFSFFGSNTGLYRTFKGAKMKFRMIWKPDPGDGSEACHVYLKPFGQQAIWQHLFTLASPVASDEPGFRTVTTSWINIIDGLDYNFIYHSYTGHGGSGSCPDHRCTMKVVILVSY